MSKMTDKEIIQALQMCHLQGVTSECKGCFYRECPDGCIENMQKDALDLIKQQQAEIEKLQIRLRKERHQFADLSKMYSEIRAEAIKEFAERLKEHLKGNGGLYCVTTMNAKFDNLVKEMVGDDNG